MHLWISLIKVAPYLVPDLGGKAFFFSPLSITLACSFHNCLYNFEALSFHSLFSRVFIMKRHWVLSSAFSAPFERFRWLFTLCSVTVLYYIDALVLNHASIPGVNPIWSWCILLLICLLNCVCCLNHSSFGHWKRSLLLSKDLREVREQPTKLSMRGAF